jgi:thioredoxin reductase
VQPVCPDIRVGLGRKMTTAAGDGALAVLSVDRLLEQKE